jgi:hypothetical protein
MNERNSIRRVIGDDAFDRPRQASFGRSATGAGHQPDRGA